MKKRPLKFKCWKCERDYSLTLELKGKPVLNVACPFCEAEAVVELDPFRPTVDTIYRNRSSEKKTIGEEWDFPDVIPTEPAPPEK
jgi:transcription elongation factor Elf1